MRFLDNTNNKFGKKEHYKELKTSKDLALPIPREDAHGLYKDVIEHLARQMNFTYELHCRFDRKWGGFNVSFSI